MDYLERLEKYGYGRDTEGQHRDIATASSGRSLSGDTANQLRHLKNDLASLVSILENDISIVKTDAVIEKINDAKIALEA